MSRLYKQTTPRLRALFVSVGLAMASIVAYADENAPAVIPSDYNAYIVVLHEKPIIANTGENPNFAATKPNKGQRINMNSSNVRSYMSHLKDMQHQSMEKGNIPEVDMLYSYTNALNGYSALMTFEQAQRIAKQKGVASVIPVTLNHSDSLSWNYGHEGKDTPNYLGASGKNGLHDKGYTGEDVVIGIVDGGIWPEHPSFEDDGSYGPSPEGFTGTHCEIGVSGHPLDAAFTCNNKILAASAYYETYLAVVGSLPTLFPESARDDGGHGTFVASLAAGNDHVYATVQDGVSLGQISGVAPRARLAVYRTQWGGSGYSSDIAAAIDQAVADGVDVINISVGGAIQDTLSGREISYLYANDAGIAVTNSAGNGGPNAGTVSGAARVPWSIAPAAGTMDRVFEGALVLGNDKKLRGISVSNFSSTLPLIDAGDCSDVDSLDVAGKIVVCSGLYDFAIVEAAALCSELGAKGFVNTTLSSPIEDVSIRDFYIHGILAVAEEIPVISLYPGQEKKLYKYLAKSNTPKAKFLQGGKPVDAKDSQLTYWSSRGPSVFLTSLINPSITAPGAHIEAAISPLSGYQAEGQLYTALGSGTSGASPLVAGAMALVKQAHPDWSAAMIQSAVMTTARQNVTAAQGGQANPFQMGNGYLSVNGDPKVCAGMVGKKKQKCERKNPFHPDGVKGSVVDPGLVFDAGFYDYLGFMCDTNFGVVSEGFCQSLSDNGVEVIGSNLNMPSIAVPKVVGNQTVPRTVTNVSLSGEVTTYIAKVISPPGFSVTVEPSQFTLNHGESQTYQVHIANESADIGEWRFGSLTWVEKSSGNKKKHGYKVYSPIAVAAAEIDATEALSVTGLSGSTSIPVKIGFDGSYSAKVHGLIAATITEVTGNNDPDPVWPPNEPDPVATLEALVAAGYAAKISVDIPVDTMVYRAAIFDETTVPSETSDLDIHLVGPDNNYLQGPGAFGSTERVQLITPEAGTYKVYIHYYDAGAENTPTLVHQYIVGPDSGNMTTTAPSSVSIGDEIDVDISWMSLIELLSPDRYLGAISHEVNGSVSSVTVVEVDTTPTP